ncbi:Microspherule protein 1 [Pleodorina starrii]|uniref:Microspherule protein 1 n=1 Tax=Pleodorina starrii TaxID=330485 RepID=A0A9W6EYC2_9CHLO|nr:Microspherule protein 1 [Pleodorina starrii]GLC49843.1 Microspherule protein 1 [Pleodorina starrii]
METSQPADDERASKRPRVGVAVDSVQNGASVAIVLDLNRIKQSENQLAYLQAQLTATESLYAAYQAELQGLSNELRDVKRSHLQSGLPLWKDPEFDTAEAAAAAQARRARRQQPQQQSDQQQQQQPFASGAGPCWDDDLETYSDVEEEVLLLQTEEEPPTAAATAAGQEPEPRQELRQQEGAAAQGSPQQQAPEGDAGTAAAATAGPGPQSVEAAAGAGAAAGEGGVAADGGAAAAAAATPADEGATAAANGASAAAAAAMTGAPGVVGSRDDLEALEATCSAVAQEDMEAQGAIACLAGRTAKYYLRSTVVTLGRTTDSKGDVDLDLTLEEPLPAPPTALGAAAAAAGSGAGGAGPAGAGGAAAAAATAGTAAADQGAAQAQAAAGAAVAAGAAAGAVAAPVRPPGSGHSVSRRQALIRLGPDGQFRLVNTGRQAVVVNDVTVPQNATVNLPHLSLIEVASVRLLFLANCAAVSRVVRRSAALSL